MSAPIAILGIWDHHMAVSQAPTALVAYEAPGPVPRKTTRLPPLHGSAVDLADGGRGDLVAASLTEVKAHGTVDDVNPA